MHAGCHCGDAIHAMHASSVQNGTDWVACGLCQRWQHINCDPRSQLGALTDYAEGGKPFYCVDCSKVKAEAAPGATGGAAPGATPPDAPGAASAAAPQGGSFAGGGARMHAHAHNAGAPLAGHMTQPMQGVQTSMQGVAAGLPDSAPPVAMPTNAHPPGMQFSYAPGGVGPPGTGAPAPAAAAPPTQAPAINPPGHFQPQPQPQ
jgi:hypothetical protein